MGSLPDPIGRRLRCPGCVDLKAEAEETQRSPNLDFEARVPVPFSIFPSSYRESGPVSTTQKTHEELEITLPHKAGRAGPYSSVHAEAEITRPGRGERFSEEEVRITREEEHYRRPGTRQEYRREERRPRTSYSESRVEVDSYIRPYSSAIDEVEREYRARVQPAYREQVRIAGSTVDPPSHRPVYKETIRVDETVVDPPRRHHHKHHHKRPLYRETTAQVDEYTVDPTRHRPLVKETVKETVTARVDASRQHSVMGQYEDDDSSRVSVKEESHGYNTVSVPTHHIRMGDILMLQGRPCQVIRISTSAATGQHRYLGVDLFTKQLHEESSNVSNPAPSVVVQTMHAPIFKQYRVLDLQDGSVVAMTETGDVKQGLPVIDQSNLWSRLQKAFDSGRGSVRVLVVNDHGHELVVDMKVIHGSRLFHLHFGVTAASEETEKAKAKASQDPAIKESSSERRSPNRDEQYEADAATSTSSSRGKDESRGRELVPRTSDDKQVRLVSPPRDRDDRKPIKGILKQPTSQFPEEPNPVREGVAPHKDDKTKNNVPPGARWTKINRKKINPEALTMYKERFEVRDDFVIVLRVLSKEEIQVYAELTAMLREKRRQDFERGQWNGDDERDHKARRRDSQYQQHREQDDDDDYDDAPPRQQDRTQPSGHAQETAGQQQACTSTTAPLAIPHLEATDPPVCLHRISTSALIFAPSLHVVQRVHPASFELFSSKAIYLLACSNAPGKSSSYPPIGHWNEQLSCFGRHLQLMTQGSSSGDICATKALCATPVYSTPRVRRRVSPYKTSTTAAAYLPSLPAAAHAFLTGHTPVGLHNRGTRKHRRRGKETSIFDTVYKVLCPHILRTASQNHLWLFSPTVLQEGLTIRWILAPPTLGTCLSARWDSWLDKDKLRPCVDVPASDSPMGLTMAQHRQAPSHFKEEPGTDSQQSQQGPPTAAQHYPRPPSIVHQHHHAQAPPPQQQQHSSAYPPSHHVYQQQQQHHHHQEPYYAQQSPYSTPGATSGYTSADTGEMMAATMQRPPYPPMSYHTPQSNSPASVASPSGHEQQRSMYGQPASQLHQQSMYYAAPQQAPYSSMSAQAQPSPYAQHPQQSHQSMTSQPSMMMPAHSAPTGHQMSQHASQHAQPGMTGSPRHAKIEAHNMPPNLPPSMPRSSTSGPLTQPQNNQSGAPLSTPTGSATGVNPNAAPGPIPATTPLVVRQDGNGVQWIAFEYSRDRVKMEYTIRCDVESVNVDELPQDFKTENSHMGGPGAAGMTSQSNMGPGGAGAMGKPGMGSLSGQMHHHQEGAAQGGEEVGDGDYMEDSQHHHHHQAPSQLGGDERSTQVYAGYGQYGSGHPGASATGSSSVPSIHDALGSSPQQSVIAARRSSRATVGGSGMDEPEDLFPDIPEAKKRKFILVEDSDRQSRLRVRVTLDGVDTREIPDSFRKGSSVYPRSYFPREMQSPPPSATGSKFFMDDVGDDSGHAAEDDGTTETEGRGGQGGRAGRTTLVKVPVGEGQEVEVAIPRMRKSMRGKEVRLNDLGYRMAWLQSRVFAGRTVFLQRALDCYRNKTRTAIENIMQDVKTAAPHFETRVGKRRWNERMRRGEKKDDDE
ncbi:hypothetical protein P8C59_009420 [Phyllachora maydis]|uniref:Uncharacterized protein n=1 Tax=Phyllachora maydis TaxID=1825666 RepID=A0AAD9ID56_9PEZI|nr:hypothetical protein P8C59_009420 [Phyllachora maydis]